MDTIETNLNLAWINYLEHFCANQTNFSYTQKENGFIIYEIINIFDTNIDISNQYGFLSLNFESKIIQDNFQEFIKVEKSITKNEYISIVRTSYPIKEFPARVYPNKLKLSFYDLDSELTNFEKFENRIIVFQSIIFALLQLKSINIINRYINF